MCIRDSESAGPPGPKGDPGDAAYGGTSPTFTYADGLLVSISYASGESKTFTYSGGVLISSDFTRNGVTKRKTFNYTSGVLTSITQVSSG